MAKYKEYTIDELDRDYATRFFAVQYYSQGFESHFHRNLEIYGVVNGEVTVTIAGDVRTLTSGQIAIINCMEAHEYDMSAPAEIFYFNIGTTYLSTFISQYKNNLLPHWLLDTEYNKMIYNQISAMFDKWESVSELKKFGVVNNLFADIIERYGVTDGGYDGKSHEFIEKVIQYIYEHYAEDITLVSLADKFCIDPKLLSKKLSRCIGIDLRMFVNDIRLRKALQMKEDPAMRDTPIKEIIRRCGFKRSGTFYETLRRSGRLYVGTVKK